MKKGFSILTLVSSLFLGITLAQAQSGLKTATKQYENLAYSESIQTYEQVAKRGFVDLELLKNTGNSYYFNGEYKAASIWYKKLFTDFETKGIEPEYLYRYAQTLKNIDEVDEAKIYLDKYALADKSSLRSEYISNEKNISAEIEKNSGRYNIKRLDINSPYSDYPSSIHDGKLIFTSARDTGNFSKRVFTWTGDSFTKLYSAEINEDGSFKKISKLDTKIDTKYNESSAVITKDGNIMYFTRNNFNQGKLGKNSEFKTLLKIYRAEMKNGKWINITELPFNSDQFSTAHPVLNKTEDVLYFVSDRPGGYGSSDIWKVKISGSGFGKPENLGPSINTEGRETFPYLTVNNELYFSSDARNGMGGLDVYATKIKDDGTFAKIQNVGAPVNSVYDDFAYMIDYKTKQGYFSSNRKGGPGKDDIFSLLETKTLEFECIQMLKVKVIDFETKNIITNPKLSLYDLSNEFVANAVLSDNAYQVFNTKYECGETYKVKFEMPNYITSSDYVNLGTESGVTELVIQAKAIPVVKEPEFKKEDDLFKKLKLLPIHFDFDKSNIRPDAATELAKIVQVMKKYPQMKIDVRSFTDSRGSATYNMKLSQQRAKSTAEWIISQGISSDRVTYKGFGDTQLLNQCRKGVKCSEEEHAINRRSEFIVTEI